MPSLSNSNDLRVQIDTKSDNKGIQDTKQELAGLDKSADKSGLSFVKLTAALAAAQAAFQLASRAISAVSGSIGDASSFQQTRIGIENMLGSADKARAVLKDVSQFAAKTPFQFPELAGSIKQLVAFGFSADDAVATMKQLGDISAAVGAPIGDLSYLMGTLRTQGRAFTIDLRQFASRGIPIYEYLAKVLGTNEAAIISMTEAGKIGFPEVQKAFKMMTNEGGKFHGTMEKQSKSLSGLFSTLKDNIGLTTREMLGITQEGDVKAGSMFDKLVKGTKWLTENLPTGVATLGRFLDKLKEIGSAVYNFLKPSLDALKDTLLTQLKPAFEQIVPYLDDIARIFGVVLVGAMWLFINTLNLVIKTISNLVQWFFIFRDVLSSVVNWAVDKAWGIYQAFSNVYGPIVGVFIGIEKAIIKVFDRIVHFISDAIGGVGGTIRKAIGNIDIPGPLGKIKDVIPGFAKGGYTGAGPTNEVAGIVHRGEYVIPKSQVDQFTGTPKAVSNSRIITVQNLNVYPQTEAASRGIFDMLDQDLVNTGMGLTPNRGKI